MPEGPSIVILKELIDDLPLHKPEIIEVSGNVKTIAKDRLLHQKVQEFRTLGKHFLICFNDFTIQIHLMLFGTYLINDTKKTPLKLGLTFKKDQINFYTCKVDLLEGNAKDLYDWSIDIMSDQWDDKQAIKTLKENPESHICDILLDQHIFAGVGNIIKNEALYRAKIHPLSKIKDLPLAKIKLLIKAVVAYSFDFLKWRKEGTLIKHWEVYNQKTCPKGHPIEKKELGKTHRQTYYCSNCQKKYS
ncbi:endonuclease [Pedobacter yonginense]|uniref:Endonuclease n=1 Tax=Pedobacter yonginense TaxID=651869 RepID=A0A317EV50_9SPHI|nr:endonuclease [Pedobacter yonginense]PWS29136.1 endonuclease [Pedobacter yonginense]